LKFAHEVAAFTPPDRAYAIAGFKSRPEFARGNACRLLREPAVAQRIEELRADFRERCALNVEYLQALLLPIVEANVLDGSSRHRKEASGASADVTRCSIKPVSSANKYCRSTTISPGCGSSPWIA
jgi:hypothetical protein